MVLSAWVSSPDGAKRNLSLNLKAIYQEIAKTIEMSDLKKQGLDADLTLFSDTIIFSTPAPAGRRKKDLKAVEDILAPFFGVGKTVAHLQIEQGSAKKVTFANVFGGVSIARASSAIRRTFSALLLRFLRAVSCSRYIAADSKLMPNSTDISSALFSLSAISSFIRNAGANTLA
jgi:hypothetical protein